MNGNHTEEEKRNKKNKTKTKRNENEKLEEISKFLISLNTRKKWGTSVSYDGKKQQTQDVTKFYHS